MNPQLRNLDTMLLCWVLFSFFSAVFSSYFAIKIAGSLKNKAINVRWIVRGLKVAIPLMGATLCYRGFFIFDRILIEKQAGLEMVAVYTFFNGIGVAMIALIEASVFVFSYPSLIKYYNEGSSHSFADLTKKMVKDTLIICVLYVSFIFLIIDIVIPLLEKDIYTDYSYIFLYVIVTSCLVVTGLVFHNILYTTGSDRAVILSNFFTLVTFFVSSFVLVNYNLGVNSILLALVIASAANVILKIYFYKIYVPKEFRIF
jgi:O-antigen/teichoic acid export membrane protein